MKKHINLILALLLMAASASAQQDKSFKKQFFVSAYGGIMYSNLYNTKKPQNHNNKILADENEIRGAYYPGNKFVFGPKLGIGVRYQLTKRFSIALDVNYQRKGGKGNVSKYIYYDKADNMGYLPEDPREAYFHGAIGQEHDINAEVFFDYRCISVPFLVQWQFGELYINTGLGLDIPISYTTHSSFDLEGQPIQYEENMMPFKHNFFDNDLAFHLGTGYNFPLTDKDNLVVGLQAQWTIISLKYGGYIPTKSYVHDKQSFILQIKYERKL
ncbi:MAG: outer membrane beta-barrel protein [Prevotellaceae bacterium]|nr:outer membrane beta-barrel protein [Prevotellaceae bacterium]